jgi:hypothetical protein
MIIIAQAFAELFWLRGARVLCLLLLMNAWKYRSSQLINAVNELDGLATGSTAVTYRWF